MISRPELRAYVNLSLDEMSGNTDGGEHALTLALSIDGAPAAIMAMLQLNLASVEANLGNPTRPRTRAGGAAHRRASWLIDADMGRVRWRMCTCGAGSCGDARILEGYELESGAVIETPAAELGGAAGGGRRARGIAGPFPEGQASKDVDAADELRGGCRAQSSKRSAS